MAFENGLERFGDVGDGINVAEFARRDDGREQRPIFGLDLVSGEQCILARKSHHPFILPMSGKSWKSITGGTRILAARLLCVGWSSEQLGNFLKCWGPPALWSRWEGGCSIPSSAPE